MTMDKERYDAVLQVVAQASRLLSLMPIDEALEYFEHAETVGPFIDPTLYHAYLHSPSARAVKPLLQAALAFKNAASNVVDAKLNEVTR